MSAIETLRALASGARPASGLLHSARLEAFGVQVYGEEAVVESFVHETLDLSKDADVLERDGHIAIVDGDKALFADLSGKNLARIWRLGGGDPIKGEPQFSVAFDTDLTQARGEVFLAASDHPGLAPDAEAIVRRAGQTIVRCRDDGDAMPAYRKRAFALRAFGTSTDGAALFAIYRLYGEPERSSGFAIALARWSAAGTVIVHDRAGQAAIGIRPWMPCLPSSTI